MTQTMTDSFQEFIDSAEDKYDALAKEAKMRIEYLHRLPPILQFDVVKDRLSAYEAARIETIVTRWTEATVAERAVVNATLRALIANVK